jgi:hypothetical protein
MNFHLSIKFRVCQPSHIFGQYLSIVHGICVPASCSNRDVEISAKYFADKYSVGTGISIDVRVREEMCQTEDKSDADKNYRDDKLFVMTM